MFGFQVIEDLIDLKEKEESSIDYFSSTENVLKLKESLLNNKTKVDLDEEMTKLLIYQKSFQANSKIIEVFDEMMNTILNLKK
jgi:flagellar hook-associated protein FlgK